MECILLLEVCMNMITVSPMLQNKMLLNILDTFL